MIDSLLNEQQEIATNIEALQKNYKKDGSERKTKKYLEAKIQILKGFISRYEANHEQIEAEATLEPSHGYFIERKKMATTYGTFLAEMRQRLNAAPTTPTIQASKIFNFPENKNQGIPAESHQLQQVNFENNSTGSDVADEIPTEVRRLVKKAGIKVNHIRSLLQQAELCVIEKRSSYQLSQKLQQLENNRSIMDQLHEELLLEIPEERQGDFPYFIHQEYEVTSVEVDEMTVRLQEATQQQSAQRSGIINNKPELKLPPIEIPYFSGQYNEWATFYDRFQRFVNENENLTDTHKISYLKTYVKGEAAKLLNHIPTTGVNYADAWKILMNRYNNRRLLVTNHVNTLLNLPNITSESATAVKTLHDTMVENLYALKNLGIDTTTWNAILIPLILKKLDNETHRLYQVNLTNPREIQPLTEFLKFLESRFQSLEATNIPARGFQQNKSTFARQIPVIPQAPRRTYAGIRKICIACKASHDITRCPMFIKMPVLERSKLITGNNLCRICLSATHSKCFSKEMCVVCMGNHNTLLHMKEVTTSLHTAKNAPSINNGVPLLATALIKAATRIGYAIQLRSLIDPGSQSSFITQEAAELLSLPKFRVNLQVSGIGGMTTSNVKYKVFITISPHYSSNFKQVVEAFILPKLTERLPAEPIKGVNNNTWKELVLADPHYDTPASIDMILGADIYGHILKEGVIKTSQDHPVAQKTELGWILLGMTKTQPTSNSVSLTMTSQSNLDLELRKFWEIEEIRQNKQYSEDEELCETSYTETCNRLADGRYEVTIPIKDNFSLGDSRSQSIARLLQVERRLEKNPQLKQEYHDFLNEYIQLGHMVPINSDDITCKNSICYLPHHAVVKQSSTTTKVRVVFDASMKTSNGLSLNDIQLVGPTMQQDLFSIITRWRKYKYVFIADIEKMYRQILITESQQNLQRIVWRNDPQSQIKEYKLRTVTYGTSSAPYLAIRTLRQLALDEQQTYPIASEILLKDFYVDDVLSGSATIEYARKCQEQLRSMLDSGGFKLRKWASNNNAVMKGIPEQQRETKPTIISKEHASIKTLGLIWNPQNDEFEFQVNIGTDMKLPTKRYVISEIAKIFDPLGWFSPTIILGKLMFQELWIKGISWDEELPEEIKKRWVKYKSTFCELQKIKIPRWVNTEGNDQDMELHGFCDASELAYAAAVYCKVTRAGKTTVTLIAGKTKVAPISQKLTLPRLELCGASLLAKLLRQISEAMDIPNCKMLAWTDSTIVLAWLQGHPSKWKTFVSNRISQIHSIISPEQWKHVKSKENPADCATRGIDPDKLCDHKLWWSGPDWLSSNTDLTFDAVIAETDLEKKQVRSVCTLSTIITDPTIIEKISSFTKTKRIIAYCWRFYWNIRHKDNRRNGALTVQELEEAKINIVKITQATAFADDIRKLRDRGSVGSKSKLLSLHPFLDKNGVIRIGGRLQHSILQYNEKHPMILPSKCHITSLILDWAHKTTLHGGVDLTLAFIRKQFWILQGKRATKQHNRRCLKCFRFNAGRATQLMGSLPAPRVTPSRTFTHTGIDYAGPIHFRMSKGRGSKSQKGYIAIFICLTTKAMHIELVSDLTSEGFLSTLKRFIARRGNVAHLYSDNATNFVAANKYLQAIYHNSDNISSNLSGQGIQWHFIPPGSPHFGGLWEAGVKLIKQHMKKIIASALLTFEELTTLLCQIEASLNSRPLCPLTDDPNELECLTPGHFIIGNSMLAPPNVEPLQLKPQLLTRWQLVDRMHNDFWKIWSKGYLQNMQNRAKWTKQQPNIKENQLVLIRDENIPPTKWIMARVIETHPGHDKLIRVVTLKTQNGTLKRSIAKISPMPTHYNDKADDNKIPTISEQPDTTPVDGSSDLKAPETTHRITRSRSAKLVSNLILYSVCLMSVVFNCAKADWVNTTEYRIKYLNQQPGCYFERQAEMNPLASDWNIIIYYDLRSFDMELKHMNMQYKSLKQICHETAKNKDESGLCMAFIQQFAQQIENIRKSNLVVHNSNKERKRVKRGFGDTIGHLMGDLFGVLNERDAEHYEQLISNLEDRSETLLNLAQNQTSIINATINIMKHNSEQTRQQLSAINNHMSLLFDTVNNLTSDTANLHKTQMINMLAIHLILIIKNIEDTQRTIIEVLTHAHNGIINSQLISPTQLEDELRKIKDHVSTSVSLPGYHLADVYEVITVKARVLTNMVIFNIQVPLIHSDIYNIYHIIPVPFEHQGQQYIINPSTTFLAVSESREYYSPMTDSDLNQCIVINTDNLICHIAPVYNTKSETSICEMNMFQHNSELHNSCNIKEFNSTNYWAKINGNNKWIFSIKNEIIYDLICGRTINAITLKGTGILQIKQGCSLKDKEFRISAPFKISSKLNAAFIPSINASITNRTFNYAKINMTKIPISKIDTTHLETLIAGQHKELHWNSNPSRHDIHQYSVSYLNFAILVGIIIAVLVWRKKQTQEFSEPSRSGQDRRHEETGV